MRKKIDRELHRKLKEKGCIVTGQYPDLHHLRSVGASGSNDEWNLLPVIRPIHQEIHSYGLNFAARKYPEIKEWLLSHGWYKCSYMNKWMH